MAHVSLYRKYRSQSFSELVGQEHVVRTLQNAISSGRMAHAYLFTGPRGTGKTSTARLLAKCLCAEGGPTPTPDPDSEISRLIAEGSCVDVVEMDAASESGVDDIRQAIVEAVEYQPMMCPFKVFIIDEVHDLSAKAFDALLKTIEEPPPHVVFVLATTEYNKVPATIRSRCQKYEFHRASLEDLVARLSYVAEQEGVQAEPAALASLARMADGGFRDGLTLLEQVMLTADGPITLANVQDQLGLVSEESVDRILVAIVDGSITDIVETLDVVARSGRDARSVLEGMMYRLADLTRAAYGVDVGASGDASREAILHETASKLGRERMLALRSQVAEAYKVIRDITLPRLWLESELLSWAGGRPAAPVRMPAVVDQPATIQPQPRPVSQAPAVTTSPQPVDRPAAATVQTDVGDASPGLSEARGIWTKLLADLPPNVVHGRKLEGSVVAEIEGDKIVVELPREISLSWFESDPRRIGYIVKLLRDTGNRSWEVTLRLGKALGGSLEPQAVELPVEGKALHEKVISVFQS